MAVNGGRALVIGALLALGGCGGGDSPRPETALGDDAVTVGSFDFGESVLLAELYSQALEAHDIPVVRAFGLGPREFVAPALDAGLVELVPEYAGTAVGFASAGAARGTADAAATHQALEHALAGSGVEALAPAPATNANAFVVTDATARRYHLTNLSDLAAVAGELRFGGPAECLQRPFCLRGLRDRYGVTFAVTTTLDAGGPVTVQALRRGDVHVGLMFTSDPAIDEFVELVDDRGLQPAENVTPLARTEVIERWGDGLVDPIDAVSGALDSDTLRDLNAADARQPGEDDVAAIAASWLRSEGLA
jgi:osmoprotectant transport system substrate-binding protein